MGLTQRFVLKRPNPNLPGEWVCAGCEAPIAEPAEDSMEVPAGAERKVAAAAEMTHSDDCTEVGMAGAQQR